MRIHGVLSLAGLVALVSSATSSQETSANCTTTDGSISLPSTNDDESAYKKPKEEQLRSSRLMSDRRFDSYSGGGRRYELPRRLEEKVDRRDEDVQGHASSRHLDHDRRFLMGASGDYFSREQSKSGQRHSTSRYSEDDYSSNVDDRRDYVNGKDMFEHMPEHYLDEERNFGKDDRHDDQENKDRDRFLKTHVEDDRRNHEGEKNGRDHPINRFDDDYVLKSSGGTKQKNEWEHPTDRSKDDYVFGLDREQDRAKIDREKDEKMHLQDHFNEDYISKVNNERDRMNTNDERNRFDTDHISKPYDKSQDKNAQSRVPSRYVDVEKSKNYHDQTFTSDLENKNSDENLNVHPSNLNGDSEDEISDVIDKSLAVLPLGQDTTTDRHMVDGKDRDVDHVTFIERGKIHDIRVDDSHPVKSLMDHKIADPIDYHHLHDAQSGPDDDQNSKRHYKDPYVDRYSKTNFDKDPYHPPDRILKDERRNKGGPSSDYHEMVSSDKDDSYPERHTSDASTSKLNPRDHHDELHSNQQDFSSHNDPLPERRLGTSIHDDARFSDDNYDRKVYGHPSNRYKEDDDFHTVPKVKDINYDKYPDEKSTEDYTTTEPRKESNVSHLMTFTVTRDWDDNRPKLIFPNKTGIERYRMATLHLDKGLFVFDFLRYFLSFIQPKDVPLDILKDTIEGKIRVPTLIGQTIYLEVVFIAVIVMMVMLMLIVPSTEFWLCCRPARYNYRRKRRRSMTCFLSLYTVIIIVCAVTMLVCNEELNIGIKTIPKTVEAVIQDLRDYHAGNAGQLRKCLTRSLDVASEAILADLDNVEELLGKPVQAQLSQETGVDIALDALMDVANSSQELAYKTDGLLKRAERAREFAADLGRETDDIRHELERAQRDCSHEDRSLCAVLDPTGLHLALRLDRVARDDRLLRLRTASRDNLTELGRQTRGEYLYVPHHVGRNTLEARNLIRREVNTARAKVSDEARSIEASGSDMTNQLDSVRELSDKVLPYVNTFERTRWQISFSIAMCVLFVWLLLFGAVCCRCGCSEGRVRPTLLWFVFFSTFLSIALWLIVMASLTIASHAEMLLCRPLDDPEFRTVEAILETKTFLGKRLSVPLKDLFEKCEENNAEYPAYQLDNSVRLEQLTSHWTWNGLTRAFSRLRVDLTGLRVLSPNLRERLQNLLYACGPNLTEHRVMIQGPILNKDLNALSDQVENVARQLTDRRTARTFQTIAAQMRDLLSRRVKPLMKMQDELVYHLATLELHLLPLQQKVNQTMSQLRNVQYFIDNQGDKIAQLKTKAFVDRLSGYLDEWRAHVLTEMSAGVSKCRPLWDILQGIKLLICSHILGPLNGFWFASFICAMTLLICTPSAHSVASGYHRTKTSSRGSVLLPSRQGSQETVVMERETWRTPPPPSVDSW